MPTHKYILSAGHRNNGRGGATGEFDWTYGSTKALKAAIEARGGQAVIIHEIDGGTDPSFTSMDRQATAALCVTKAATHGPFDAYISSHYNGGRSPGFHVLFPDGWTATDTKAANPADVRLCRRLRDTVKATNTVGILSWTADSPGVMSERESGAVNNIQGRRLGEFVGSVGFRETTARVILEAGSIDVARERAFITDPAWVRNVYAEAVVDALEAEFGPFAGVTPAPPPTTYARPIKRPWVQALRSGPSFVDAEEFRWVAIPGAEYGVARKDGTPRYQNPTTDGKIIGADLEHGGTVVAEAVGVHLETNAAWIVSIWDTLFQLDHLTPIRPPSGDMS